MKLATVIQLIGWESITECVFMTRWAIRALGMTSALPCRQQLIAEGFGLNVSDRIICFRYKQSAVCLIELICALFESENPDSSSFSISKLPNSITQIIESYSRIHFVQSVARNRNNGIWHMH